MGGSADRSVSMPSRSARRAEAAIRRRLGRARAVLGDRRGTVAVVTAMTVPILAGFVGLGTEIGFWMYARQTMQGAADSAALGATNAIAVGDNAKVATEARAVAATY